MKHLEVRQKYSAARRIFNSLLVASCGDETVCFSCLNLDIFFLETFSPGISGMVISLAWCCYDSDQNSIDIGELPEVLIIFN